jgi:eukaryotic-like serine/threonine-protein kinase
MKSDQERAMSDQTSPDDARRQRLDEVIGAFLVAFDAGGNPNPREWLDRHPDLHPELSDFFADRERVDGLIEPIRVAPALQAEALTVSLGAEKSISSVSLPQMSLTATELATEDTTDRNDHGEAGPLEAGIRVRYFGDYELQKVLGEGGMGIVYKARQISLNRPVALKMIKSAALASNDELRRFQNEAEAVAMLDHPQIVPILEVGDHAGQRYFSMKLIVGTSLDKKLADYGANPRAAAKLLKKAGEAVHHAHQRGILHRDLKPANILLDERGEPYVSDFGLAKTAGDSELTHSGVIMGTPAYMAPEQASGRRGAVTIASDVYGLGAVLYALLAGRAPFHGYSVNETLEHVRQSTPTPPSRINPRTPRDLEVICLTCLEKDPVRRYVSTQALADDLARYLAGEPIAARPVGSVTRIWMWCRRNPSLAGSFGAAAAALAAVVIFALLYADRKARLATLEADKAREQTLAAKEISSLADNLRIQRDGLRSALATSNQRLAVLHFERGQSAFENGQTGVGLLWMLESWRSALAADDPGWQRTARADMAVWQGHAIPLKAVFSHQRPVECAAFSPDGRSVLTGSWDKTARLWDVVTGRPIGSPMAHDGGVGAVAFSPDGNLVLTGSGDKTSRLWAAATGEPIGPPMAHQGAVDAVTFSPDGRSVVTGSWDKTARLWDVATGRPIGSPMVHQGGVGCVAFSPGGKAILTGSADKTARLWDVATCKPIGLPLTHEGAVRSVAFSPDGKAVLTGSIDKTARLWYAATGKPIGPPLVHHGRVQSVAFSPDGKAVVTGSVDKTARLWDVRTGKPIGTTLTHQGSVDSVAFSPDGKAVVTGSEDKTARLWDSVTGQPIGPPMAHQEWVRAVSFSPDGNAVLTGSHDNTARLWEMASGRPIGPPMAHQDEVLTVAFSPDGKAVVTGSRDNTARLWDAASGKPIGPPMAHHGHVWAVAFSPDCRLVVTGSDDHTARLWNAANGNPIGTPMAHERDVRAVAFSPDSGSVLTGSWDKTARLWNAATGGPIGTPMVHQGAVMTVAFSPDGKTVLSGSYDNTARLWNAVTGEPLSPSMAHHGAVITVAFSPDGKIVLTGSFDNTARLWNATTGVPMGPPMAHQNPIRDVRFSPDGKAVLVLTDSRDESARIWDAATGERIGSPLAHLNAVLTMAFSPDGKAVLTGNDDGTALLRDAATGKPIGPSVARGAVWNVAFSPDGKAVVALNGDKTVRLWAIPELRGDLKGVADWTAVVTGLELDEHGSVHVLDNATWRQRREQLNHEGGPTYMGRLWRLDPVLFGLEPTARARAWIERQRWAEAEVAFDEAVLARPLDADVVLERARFHVARSRSATADKDFFQAIALGSTDSDLIEMILRSEALFARAVTQHPDPGLLWRRRGDDRARRQRWAEAAKDYGQLIRLQPEDLWPRHCQILALGAAGDHDQLQRACSEILDRYGRTAVSSVANDAAWSCSLAPSMDERPEELVRLAELGADGAAGPEKGRFLNTVGAALYRAGRFEEAIRRLDEAIQLKGGASEPRDWAFLAMAHQRLEHRDQARHYLKTLSSRQPSSEADQLWAELEIRVLRSEAEATILYDPIFPADPFAH